MAYCTYPDVQLKVGTSLGTITTVDITAMIVESDREIGTRLREREIAVPTTADDDLQIASVQLTVAQIKRRQAHELSRPNSASPDPSSSFSASPEAEAAAAEAKAEAAIARYAKFAGGSGVAIVRSHRMLRGF